MAELILRPNGTVYFTGARVPSGVEPYENIDEEVCDNDTTYLYWTANARYQHFSYPSHTTESGAIASITFHTVAKKAALEGKEISPYDQTISVAFGSSYYVYTYKFHTITEEYAEYTTEAITTNPITEEAWTWEDVDGLEDTVYGSPLTHGKYANRICFTQSWFSIEYAEGATVTTNAASEISYDCAMGNGEITSGTNASERGFDYYIDGDSGNVLSVNEEGDFAEGTYALEIEGLNPNTKYWYRAKAKIDGEIYYGEYTEFTTEPITLENIKADRQGHLAKIRLYGEIL